MANSITVAKFRDVAGGLQAGQFAVGDRVKINGLSGLDPIYKALLDRPITVTLGRTTGSVSRRCGSTTRATRYW